MQEDDVVAILANVLHLGYRDKLPAAQLAEALTAHGIGQVYAAFAPAGTYHVGSRKDLWFACDVGLLYCTMSGGLADALVLNCDLTSWRDVRDVELGGKIARAPKGSGRYVAEDARDLTELHLVIQLPRLEAHVYGGDEVQRLAKFARQVLLHYHSHG